MCEGRRCEGLQSLILRAGKGTEDADESERHKKADLVFVTFHLTRHCNSTHCCRRGRSAVRNYTFKLHPLPCEMLKGERQQKGLIG